MSAAVNALFIGNSYTHFNNLPTLVASVIRALPDAPSSVSTAMFVADGATVAELLNMSASLDRIRSGHFTHVVVQGQSYEPLVGFANFNDSATQFVAAINASGALPLLYETWAREKNSEDYQMPWSGGSPSAMHAALRNAYMRVANSSGATMAPVGDAFARCVTLWPHINLYDTDLAHPSRLGSSLAAMVFANVFTGQAASGSGQRGIAALGIDADDGVKLQAVADCVCDELRGVATSCNRPSTAGATSTTMVALSTLASQPAMIDSSPTASNYAWLIVLLVIAIALALVGGLAFFKFRARGRSARRSVLIDEEDDDNVE
jgi:hypothetical protein